MIKILELHNFKSIKKKKFELRNLNVLLGLNGQGKSSFIQSLLLLRQSSDCLSDGYLRLNGSEVSLGTIKDVLYQFTKNDLFIQFSFIDNNSYSMYFKYEADSDVFTQDNEQTVASTNYLGKNNEESLFSKGFQYLEANRIEPKTIHNKSSHSIVNKNNIGKNGEYTVHYLDSRGGENIEFENCAHKNTNTFLIQNEFGQETKKDISLKSQVNLWLGEISPGVNIKTTSISGDQVKLEYEFNQPNLGKTNAFTPVNVGFGISYGLHVITALLAAKKGQLLIIENPESHIHPRGQAELGKLIALVAQNDIQIVIETHSDHIINGIRVGVKEMPNLKDKTILFYFEKELSQNEQFSKITDIFIDENGTLSKYRDNLLEEWSNQLLKLL